MSLSNHPEELSAFHDELLTCLAEECAEVIVELCKAKRIGPDKEWLADTARGRLARELGELVLVVDELLDFGVIDRDRFLTGFKGKRDKLRTWMRHHPEEPGADAG